MLALGIGDTIKGAGFRSAPFEMRHHLHSILMQIPPCLWLEGAKAVGFAAGASVPEVLVSQVIKFLKEQGVDSVEELTVAEEDVEFLLPKELLMASQSK
jgi:hypothetical protein